ncbi:hypothetical protein [Pseudomonas sp. W2Jun17]|uniref:hypothetical protein n=1 Tax=Pseudomonas sp. W2Jun17 TaxID=1553460 RepID=UPI00200491A1|nr:hypothetical protein [Pseudomonas sp. W2Jun17]MCK3851533.1 hypothetical protein [Pseudomonas sp. W2Jun17]
MWEWISANNGSLALFLSLMTAGSAIYHYLSIKKSEERDRRFANYHKLVEDLNSTGSNVDKQLVIIFELRNFPEYYPATIRLLNRSLEKWQLMKSMATSINPHSLIDEAKLTLSFISRKQNERSYLCTPEEDRL